jgi:hypothetical protein
MHQQGHSTDGFLWETNLPASSFTSNNPSWQQASLYPLQPFMSFLLIQPQAEPAEDVLLKALLIKQFGARLESDIMGRVVGEASFAL